MNRNAVRDRRLHAVLCAGLSIATLGMVASARAADLFKAPPPPQGETQLWIAGGAFDPGGDAIHFGPGARITWVSWLIFAAWAASAAPVCAAAAIICWVLGQRPKRERGLGMGYGRRI